MKRLFYLMLVVLGTMAFVSCSDDDDENKVTPVYGEITINTTPSIEYDGSVNNTISLTIHTFNEGDEISIDYGNNYTPTVTSPNDRNNYTYELKYTFPDEEDHIITIKGNISGIYCYHNNDCYITSLDVSKCTGLNRLQCENHPLTSLNVSGCTALEYLWCYDNQLTSLDVSKCPNLIKLDCSDNELTSLDVSKNIALTELSCGGNELTTLDVSKNTILKSLGCSENPLTSLDVSKNTALESLGCFDNQLTSLDVSKNTALESLICFDNQLTSLDVSKNTALEILWCHGNQFTATEMNKIYEALPTVEAGELYCGQLGNPGIAEQKGWEVSFY